MWWFLLLVALLGMAYVYWKSTSKSRPAPGMGFRVDPAPKARVEEQLELIERDKPVTQESDEERKAKVRKLLRDALRLFDGGDELEAEKLFIQILGLEEKHNEANQKLGMLYLKKGLAAKAEPFFKVLVELEKDNVSHFSNLGYALFMQNRLEEAKDAYESALALDSSRAGRFASLAQVYMAMKEHDHAINLLKRALAKEERNVDFLLLLADNYKNLSMHSEAIEALENVLQVEPEHEEARSWIVELKASSVVD